MPSLFLSYASEDEAFAKALEEGLRQHDITVWRDRTSLHAGDKWPKRLGEAIAENDFFLLLWSQSSSTSDFVELEWTTAIALKKTILPILVDRTELPASLAETNGIRTTDQAQAVQEVLAALNQPELPADQKRNDEVIEQLAAISSINEAEVLQEAKAVFQQSSWEVQGDMYQAGGNIHITTSSPNSGKSRLEKAAIWVGLIVGLLTIVGLVLDLPEKLKAPSTQKAHNSPAQPKATVTIESSKEKTTKPIPRILEGLVKDEATGQPLEGVSVSVQGHNIGGTTNSEGYFKLMLPGSDEGRVLITATKEQYETFYTRTEIGNDSLGLMMERSAP